MLACLWKLSMTSWTIKVLKLMVFDITVKACESWDCSVSHHGEADTVKFASEDPFGHISCATHEPFAVSLHRETRTPLSHIPSFQSAKLPKWNKNTLSRTDQDDEQNEQTANLTQTAVQHCSTPNTPTTQQLVLDRWRLHIVFTQARLGRWGCR